MDKKIIINIGRQFGSGGLAVAKEIGRMLGIPVFDNELISKASQESGFSADIFVQNDERRQFFSSIFENNYVGENYMSGKGLFKMQSEAIRSIAEQGSAVIVGRCSDFILRESDCTLDIFLTSPSEVRAQRVAERQGISLEKAEAMIEKKDKDRASYYNYYTFGEWGTASNYDLCIESSILGIEGTAAFIIEFAKRKGLL